LRWSRWSRWRSRICCRCCCCCFCCCCFRRRRFFFFLFFLPARIGSSSSSSSASSSPVAPAGRGPLLCAPSFSSSFRSSGLAFRSSGFGSSSLPAADARLLQGPLKALLPLVIFPGILRSSSSRGSLGSSGGGSFLLLFLFFFAVVVCRGVDTVGEQRGALPPPPLLLFCSFSLRLRRRHHRLERRCLGHGSLGSGQRRRGCRGAAGLKRRWRRRRPRCCCNAVVVVVPPPAPARHGWSGRWSSMIPVIVLFVPMRSLGRFTLGRGASGGASIGRFRRLLCRCHRPSVATNSSTSSSSCSLQPRLRLAAQLGKQGL
jgi:hypothetical protein